MTPLPCVLRSVSMLLLLALSASVSAQERWLLSIEGGGAMTLGDPHGDWFNPGATGAISVGRSFHAKVAMSLRLRGAFFFDGPAPEAETGFADPGIGTLSTLGLALRVRPFGDADSVERATGFWIEGGGGVGLTGDLWRSTFEGGLGFTFPVGRVDVGPAIRYLHVIQPSGQLESSNGHVLVLGLDLVLLDGRDVDPVEETPEPPGDRDGDGYVDPEDGCPDEPEDFDEFEDEDGCPDEDNDGDGVLDVDDACPMIPEDADGFEDEDGCPDPDNDQDGIPDLRDACPNEPEVINGIDDEDGCPDEGLIEMVDDRIVLDENVLFDFQRARVKRAAWPIVDAIVVLIAQHPEWSRMAIEGHADVRGNEDYNRSLSHRRARNVVRALVRRGVEPERLSFEGFGSARPRARGRSERAHQQNRRVEFVIAEAGEPAEAEAEEAETGSESVAVAGTTAGRSATDADANPEDARVARAEVQP